MGVEILVTMNAWLSQKARRAVIRGREFAIAPATLIVPGVLNGSKGALYYPPSEVAQNEGLWNHTPMTVGHPTDPVTNLPVSGKDPDVLDRVGIGYVFNDHVGRRGQRLADLYFDVEATSNYDRKYGTNILYRVDNGLPIELSTGLYTENEPARNGARDHMGRPYDYIARNYRPDHLAILPDAKGACSVSDGCGANVRNAGGTDEPRDEEGRWAGDADVHATAVPVGEDEFSGRRVHQSHEELGQTAGFDDDNHADPMTRKPTVNLFHRIGEALAWLVGNYSPDQPRDQDGKFAGGGEGPSAGNDYASKFGGMAAHFDRDKNFVEAVRPPSAGGVQVRELPGTRSQEVHRDETTLEDMEALAKTAGDQGMHAEAVYQHEGLANIYRNRGDELSALSHDAEAARHRRVLAPRVRERDSHQFWTGNRKPLAFEVDSVTGNERLAFCPDCGKHMPTDNCGCGYTRNDISVSGTGMSGSPLKVGIESEQGGGGGDTPATNDCGGGQSAHIRVGDKFGTARGPTENDDEDAGGDTDDAPTGNQVVLNTEGEDMPLTANQRKGIVDDLCVNCDCYKGQEKVVNAFTDEALLKLKEHTIQERNNRLVADSVRNGLRIKVGNEVVTVNAGTRNGQLVVNAFGGMPMGGGGGGKAEGSNADATQTNGTDIQAGGEEDAPGGHAGVHAELKPDKTVKGKLPPGVANAAALQNDPWFRQAPPYMQQMLLNQAAREDEHRRQLAVSLVPNHVTNQQARERLVANYLKLDTPDLEFEVKVRNAAPRDIPLAVPPVRVPTYGGGMSLNDDRVTDNRRGDDADLLELPTMDWGN